ncbi:MAG: FAD-binding oxidoreductase [Xanthomonadaceae bacterium]|nr:FAD-binding oxidoreductase [Xanthomonadaceae bacterium]
MDRRRFLQDAAAASLLPLLGSRLLAPAWAGSPLGAPRSRVRPGDPGWPAAAQWEQLRQAVGGRLIELQSPLHACLKAPDNDACRAMFAQLRNPFYIGDQPGLTQSSGWFRAWTSHPSAYAVAAESTADVVAAVNFARAHNLRLVVKGGGHSYQGTSDAADSLLVWTRHMSAITLHDAFVGQGCAGTQAPQPAVTIEAGAMWADAYHAVTTQAGRYVQGGGCTSVGVAGLVQSGGFGSFSKNYGTAAAGLLEAEIVTADGAVRIANACTNPDLFWGIKGGGGGSLGVVTRLTLRTRELAQHFGGASAKIKATSATAFRALIGHFVDFYAEHLLNPHWGEQIKLEPDHTLDISMVSQGLDSAQARAVWQPFFDWVAQSPHDYVLAEAPSIGSGLARHWWDVAWREQHAPGSMIADPRPGAPSWHAWWSGDGDQVGVYWHGFESAWLPATLLAKPHRQRLADALFAASAHWEVGLHFNKGLAGAPAAEVAAARDTATHPAVLGAFALAIIAAGGPPPFPGNPFHAPAPEVAQEHAARVASAMAALRRVAPDAGAYVSESDYFDKDWQRSFWGSNYPRLAAVKRTYDPEGLFFVHHGVGSEAWSDDGFTRLA